MKTALVISPHADDAAAFCGATLAKFAAQGWKVVLVRVTDDAKDSVGHSIEETIRIIEAFQFHAENGEVCPANWTKDAKSMKPTDEGLKDYFKG